MLHEKLNVKRPNIKKQRGSLNDGKNCACFFVEKRTAHSGIFITETVLGWRLALSVKVS